MSAYKRGDRWHVRFQVAGQHFSSTLGAAGTRADAIAYEARIRADLLAGKLGKMPSRSVDDALAKWLENEASQLKSYANLLGKVRAVMEHTKGVPLQDIATVAQNIRSAGIKDGLKPATINRRIAIVRRVANLAHDEWGWLRDPIGKRIKLLPGELARDVYLTVSQVEQLAEACEHSGVALAIRLAARTGLRETELLRAESIVDGCIVVRSGTSKNSRPRNVPVPVDMPGLTLPIGITYNTLRRHFEQARHQVGIDHVWWHDLRHTAASWWIASGASLAIVRDLLGHSNVSVTSRYLHLMTGDLKRASDNLASITRPICTDTAHDDASE
jgi:integrase